MLVIVPPQIVDPHASDVLLLTGICRLDGDPIAEPVGQPLPIGRPAWLLAVAHTQQLGCAVADGADFG